MVKVVTIVILLFTAFPCFSQNDKDAPCKPKSPHAKRIVEFFLIQASDSIRQESGATNESTDNISAVNNDNDCNTLSGFILNTPKYNEINQSLDEAEKTIYYYQTTNFYYVFWAYKPEFYRPSMGPRKIFIVINKETNQHWEYYL